MEILILIIGILTLICLIAIIVLLNRKKDVGNNDIVLRKLEEESKLTREINGSNLRLLNETMFTSLKELNTEVMNTVKELIKVNQEKLSEVKEELAKGIQEVRYNVDKNLRDVREETAKQLTEIREIVDEKITKTLNERINESFKLVSEKLDSVTRSLGEVNQLASNVVDLKKVMSNVKTRGTWGEVSLDNILSNILTEEQFVRSCNVSGKKSQERVDFAILLPGTKDDAVYLPIDVKFPIENYQRLVDAIEKANAEEILLFQKQLENDIKTQAKSICEKYINPPHTTDFAVMYLPIEGLYAEIARKGGLIEELQYKYRVVPSGPSTISALLNSLQLGFKTLAIQKSTKEIFDIFKLLKKDLTAFTDNIDKAQEQLSKASDQLSTATKKSKSIEKRLNKVELYSSDEQNLNLE